MKTGLRWQQQNSFGTAVTNSLDAGAIAQQTLTDHLEIMARPSFLKRLATSPFRRLAQEARGGITCEMRPFEFQEFTRAALGYQTAVASSNGINTYTTHPTSVDLYLRSALAPFTFQFLTDAGAIWQVQDLVCSRWELETRAKGLAQLNTQWIGSVSSWTTTVSFAPVTSGVFLSDQSSVSWAGAGDPDFESVRIAVDNHMQIVRTLSGTQGPYAIKRDAPRSVTVEADVIFSTTSRWAEFLASSESQLIVTLPTSGSLDASVTVRNLRIMNYQVQPGTGVLKARFLAQAQPDTNGRELQTTLKTPTTHFFSTFLLDDTIFGRLDRANILA